METKLIYKAPREEIDRFTISAVGNFNKNTRRAIELCKEMNFSIVECTSVEAATACREVGMERTDKISTRSFATIKVPTDIKEGEYVGTSAEKFRQQVYAALMNGKLGVRLQTLCPGAMSKSAVPGPLFHYIKEINFRIQELGRTMMALKKVQPSKAQVLANADLPKDCAVSEFKDSEGNRYLMIQNTDCESRKPKQYVFPLSKKYRVYRVNPHDGRQQIMKENLETMKLIVMPGEADLLRFQSAEEEPYFIEYALKK